MRRLAALGQSRFVNDQENRVNRPAPPSALRQIRDHLIHPATLAALAAVIVVLTLAGPFGTGQSLSVLPRLGYWAAMALTTYATGTAVDILLSRALLRLPMAAAIGAIALVTGVAVTLVAAGLNGLLLGRVPGPATLAQILAVAVATTWAIQIVGRQAQARASGADPAGPETPPLLDRMPPGKRAPLVALSGEDHYTRVRTTRGEEMVLMRLSDAIREAAPTKGLRVHRSHWVALAAVTSVQRDGDRAQVSLISGGDIPVSRAHIPALKQAGLLPRS